MVYQKGINDEAGVTHMRGGGWLGWIRTKRNVEVVKGEYDGET